MLGMFAQVLLERLILEQYDYSKKSTSFIRATEATVAERIPARVEIRNNAVVELPHVMLLVDDAGKHVIEPCEQERNIFHFYMILTL